MCGRFILGVVREELEKLVDAYYDIGFVPPEILVPRYNVAPGQAVVAIAGDGQGNRIGLLRWGFVPWFAKDEKGGFAMINARAESLLEKPVYAQSLAKKRCLVLADGFYEWKKEGSEKTPMRIFLRDVPLFAMAGLYGAWVRPDGTKLYSCAIVTTAANDFMKPIHERMPAILSPEKQKLWLGAENTDLAGLVRLLVPYDSAPMDAHAVSTRVNDSAREGIDCIARV